MRRTYVDRDLVHEDDYAKTFPENRRGCRRLAAAVARVIPLQPAYSRVVDFGAVAATCEGRNFNHNFAHERYAFADRSNSGKR